MCVQRRLDELGRVSFLLLIYTARICIDTFIHIEEIMSTHILEYKYTMNTYGNTLPSIIEMCSGNSY